MIQSGMLSVTFRKLTPEEIVDLAVQAKLEAIEWGGDIHVPHGNIAAAIEVHELTEQAGLVTASYGSYYRAGAADNPAFEDVLETAVCLDAPAIRVWAGNRGSAEADDAWWSRVAEDTIRIAGLAEQAGIEIHYEYHRNTLTDTADATDKLLGLVNHPNVRSNWQPPTELDAAGRLDSLRRVLPQLANLHVFHWEPGVRLPLEAGEEQWDDYIRLARMSGAPRYAMLEFVKDDSPQQFLKDAAVLRRLLSGGGR
ncbi:sugar phosphate isomerase/epimerase [Paenibacillus sp. IB182496]|uniref:Sugar phosphate isomerase/epimerase n=1 Tax=Paenibacillus sabuli TaxID=2772509 RepID=A0A927BSK0_9BACL|nr:TIM barrel protein [Paenibacillus sabuli]MBD2845996.1 sugar phosphate isomerase/epimerase [Paenibacillus sabuli]